MPRSQPRHRVHLRDNVIIVAARLRTIARYNRARYIRKRPIRVRVERFQGFRVCLFLLVSTWVLAHTHRPSFPYGAGAQRQDKRNGNYRKAPLYSVLYGSVALSSPSVSNRQEAAVVGDYGQPYLPHRGPLIINRAAAKLGCSRQVGRILRTRYRDLDLKAKFENARTPKAKSALR